MQVKRLLNNRTRSQQNTENDDTNYVSTNIQPKIKQMEIKHKFLNSKNNVGLVDSSRNDTMISYAKYIMTDEELERQFIKAVKDFEGKTRVHIFLSCHF